MKNVLIVDDYSLVQIVFSDLLAMEGYQVISRDNGFSVKDFISNNKQEMVPLDTRSEGDKNLEFLVMLKSWFPDLFVIPCISYSVLCFETSKASKNDRSGKRGTLVELKSTLRTC